MSPGAQVVTRGLFLMVGSSQDMMRFSGDGDKQLVICGSSQGLSCREVIRQVAAAPQSCPPQKRSPTRPGRHKVAKRPLSLVQHNVTVVVPVGDRFYTMTWLTVIL